MCQDYKSIDKAIKVVSDNGNINSPFATAFGSVWVVTNDYYITVYVYIFDGQDQLVRKFGMVNFQINEG